MRAVRLDDEHVLSEWPDHAGGRDVPPAEPRRDASPDVEGRRRRSRRGRHARTGDPGRARRVLSRAHRAGDRRGDEGSRRRDDAGGSRLVPQQDRGSAVGAVPRLHGLQDRILESGACPSAVAAHSGRIRPPRDGAGLRRRAPHDGRGHQARVCGPRSLLRGSGLRPGAWRRAAVGALRARSPRADRSPPRQPRGTSR